MLEPGGRAGSDLWIMSVLNGRRAEVLELVDAPLRGVSSVYRLASKPGGRPPLLEVTSSLRDELLARGYVFSWVR